MPEIMHLFPLTPKDQGQRLDRVLAAHLGAQGISREKAKRLIKEGRVRVLPDTAAGPHNDDIPPQRSPRETLPDAGAILVSLPESASSLTPEEGDLTVLYRDAFLAVVNKPAGLTVHPCPSCPEGTLAHRLVAHFPELAAQEGFRPGIVHRLDKDTSGLLLVALTEKTRLALAAMFAERAVEKEYLALVHGIPPPDKRSGQEGRLSGHIDAPVGRHPAIKVKMAVVPSGKAATSFWRVLYADPQGKFSLVAVRIPTGRTHQIRVHMAHIGHPLWGDALYGPRTDATAGQTVARQMLHAWKLAFTHPFPPEGLPAPVCFSCPPPEDFFATARLLASRTLRIVITGSPGCGKSTLLARLAEHGLPVCSADAVVAALYAPGGDGQHLLRARFGNRFVPDADSPVNKRRLGTAMRESPALRREVEELLHPLVRHAVDDFWNEQQAAPLAVAEIPLYLEACFDPSRGGPTSRSVSSASQDAFPKPSRAVTMSDPMSGPVLVGVHCPFPQRAERLATRGWTGDTIAAVESWQWPEEDKMRACDLVVRNMESPEALARDAARLVETLLRLREERIAAVVERIRAACGTLVVPGKIG